MSFARQTLSSAYVRAVRELVAEGMSDTEIAIQLAEQAAEDAASAAEHEAMYGVDDPHEADRTGPSYLHCDGHYARNDAGEWIGLM